MKMQYIVHKRFKQKAMNGEMVNLPAKTECIAENGIIYHNHRELCHITSENAHLHFARNDDGLGLERGQLIKSIVSTLSKQDADYQKRWDKVWDDATCNMYRRPQHEEHWLWGQAFFNADITTLQYIADLVGARR